MRISTGKRLLPLVPQISFPLASAIKSSSPSSNFDVKKKLTYVALNSKLNSITEIYGVIVNRSLFLQLSFAMIMEILLGNASTILDLLRISPLYYLWPI
jgi:hypothetical protein